MKLLIIGGTIFLGRHLVDIALAHGHEVTLFNRGKHNPDLYPEVEKIHGDRREDLSALDGRRWDAVVDTCGYFPRDVREMARRMADAADHYTFISSISAYGDVSTPNMDESGPVARLPEGDDPDAHTEVTGENYGPLKVLCEEAAEEAMPGRVANVRAGLIVGPWDPSDRFTYWPHRASEGGEVLAPGRPEAPTQFIDVRDLASWILLLAENRHTGVYNATGPDYVLTMGKVLEECVAAADNDASLTWVDEAFLMEHKAGPWMELPLWLPEVPEYAGFNSVDCGRAIANGLTYRPVAETVRDTMAWDATLPPGRELRAGMKRERETELLKLWHERAEVVVGEKVEDGR
jgi:2'-hydroxyisoflavone reductase